VNLLFYENKHASTIHLLTPSSLHDDAHKRFSDGVQNGNRHLSLYSMVQ
jgi:hypothetical protein